MSTSRPPAAPRGDRRTSLFAPAAALEPAALDRAKFRVEVKDQAVRERMTALEKVEIRSQDPTAQQALIETIMNRALARGQTLLRTMQADYYDSIRTGAFETARKSLTAENLTAHDVRVEMVLRGSNVANLTTGNRHADADPDSVHIFECSVDRNVGTDPVGIEVRVQAHNAGKIIGVKYVDAAGRSFERMEQFKTFEEQASSDAQDSIYWKGHIKSGVALGTLRFFGDGRADYTEELFNGKGKIGNSIKAHCHLGTGGQGDHRQ